jgi:hypothetical protein
MPNTNAPFGFRPIRRLDGAAASGAFSQLKIANADTNALNRGDVVQQLATGFVTRSVAGLATGMTRGVFIGCHYLSAALGYPIWSNYWPGSGAAAGTTIDAFIIDDPWRVFEARIGGAGGPATFANIGMNCDFLVNASTTGFSAWAIDPTTILATATLPFRIVALGNNAQFVGDGYDASSPYNIVEVAWNSQFFKQLSGI